MSESDRVRLEIVVDAVEGETSSDTAMRAKRLLMGMDEDSFQDVSVRRWQTVEPETDQENGGWVEHLKCTICGVNPTYALISGDGFLVCHCTHIDGTMEPWPVHGFHVRPEEWEFVSENPDRNSRDSSTDTEQVTEP